MDQAEIRCTRPDGTIEKVTWRDLQPVEILATQDGPDHADTFWMLNGASGGCLIPWGATGHDLLFGTCNLYLASTTGRFSNSNGIVPG